MTRARELANIADGDITGTLTLDDIVLSNDMSVADNGKVQFGAGNDLQIYHTGGASYVQDNGSGNLVIDTNGAGTYLMHGSEIMASFVADGAVGLRHDNSEKLATTSTGVDVTGTVTADGLTIDGDATVSQNMTNGSSAAFTDPHLALKATNSVDTTGFVGMSFATSDNTNYGFSLGAVRSSGGVGDLVFRNHFNSAQGTKKLNIATGGDISFYDETGVTQGFFWDASTQRLGLGTTSPSVPLHVKASAPEFSLQASASKTSGSRASFNAYNSDVSTVGYIRFGAVTDNVGTDIQFANRPAGGSVTERMRIDSSGNVGIGVAAPFADLTVGTSTTFNNGDNYISAVFQPSISAGESAGMLFGHYPVSGYAKQGIFWERYVGSSGSGGRGNLHFVNRDATDTSVPTTADARMTITADGKVGIGGTPNDTLHVYGDIVIENTTNTPYIDFVESGDNTDSKARILMNQDSGTNGDLEFHTEGSGTLTKRVVFDHDGHVQIQCNNSTGDLLWKEGTTDVWAIKTNGANSHLAFYDDYNNAERMRISNSGVVLIGVTSFTSGGGGIKLGGVGDRDFSANTTNAVQQIGFHNPNGEVGSIFTSGTSTSFATSSDYRLKEAVVDMTGAIDRVKALSPKRFQFIADPDTTVDGFLAHEAQAVVPEAVTGTHNEVDADGNAVMQGIDQSKLVPLLTGALQEAIAKIETLENKVAALENA